MNTTNRVISMEETVQTRAAIRRRMAQVVGSLLFQAATLFAAAGRVDWRAAWAYIGASVGIVAVNAVAILPRNPELIAERGRPEASKGWDRVLTALLALIGLTTPVAAGLEARSCWSRKASPAVQFFGFASMVLGYGLVSWAMASNRFFSTAVRIQKERGHEVVSGGPYRHVRHPGYSGIISSTLGTPLLLGSRWALIPAGLTAALYVVRTVLEDRTLQNELDGYREYADRVRYRLIPGVW